MVSVKKKGGNLYLEPLVVIRIYNAILSFNVPQLEVNLEPNYNFAFLKIP